MSLEEAVDLVLFAFENGNQGDLFAEFFAEEIQAQNAEKLENAILNNLKLNSMTNNDMYRFVLLQEFKCKHANDILNKLQKEGRIIVTDLGTGKRARKGSFYLTYDNYRNNSPKIKIEINNENNKNRMDR